MHPTKKIARIAGAFYLLNIVTIWLAIFLFRGLFVSGDPVRTAANLTAHNVLFRAGFASELASTTCSVVVAVFLYELLRAVNRSVSLLAAFFRLLACSMAVMGYLFQLAPLQLLHNAPQFGTLGSNELQALASTLASLRGPGSNISILFFGLHFVLLGYLIITSTFLPRLLGLLCLIAGVGGCTFLLPPLGAALFWPYLAAIGLTAELSVASWLLFASVNVDRWNEQAAAEKMIFAS